MNVIFSMMQNNDAWTYVEDEQEPTNFYSRNVKDLVAMQRQYAKVIGADYYHFNDIDMVEYVKENIPVTNMTMFVQYYEFARFIKMNELSKKYDKVVYLDVDIIPVTTTSIFDKMNSSDTFYTTWFHLKTCPFYYEMETFIEGLKDTKYKYRGHTNTGVMGVMGNTIQDFFDKCLSEINDFIDGVSSFYDSYIGFEHFFMYLEGRKLLNIKMQDFGKYAWNLYGLADEFESRFSNIDELRAKFIHFCGVEAKKLFEKEKELISEIVRNRIGDY